MFSGFAWRWPASAVATTIADLAAVAAAAVPHLAGGEIEEEEVEEVAVPRGEEETRQGERRTTGSS
jgi:hypothetical protein